MEDIYAEYRKLHEDLYNEDHFSRTGLGPHITNAWKLDPKHIIFSLARYKFVSKMLQGDLVEIGCGDGSHQPLVLENAASICGFDLIPQAIEFAAGHCLYPQRQSFHCLDIIKDDISGYAARFDGAYSLDVIEHIENKYEDAFINRIKSMLKSNGSLIIGTPNVYAFEYSSPQSRRYHINNYSHKSLKALLEKYFHNVFMFSMNDEVLHVGFEKMAHYIFALATTPKEN